MWKTTLEWRWMLSHRYGFALGRACDNETDDDNWHQVAWLKGNSCAARMAFAMRAATTYAFYLSLPQQLESSFVAERCNEPGPDGTTMPCITWPLC